MKRGFALLLSILFVAAVPALAHTPLLLIADNGDGTLSVEGGFSTGASAAGIDFFVKNKLEGKVLLHRNFPESSTIEIKIPPEPYYLVLDAGPGHKVVKDGPAPPGGFKKNIEAVSLQPEESDASGMPISLPGLIGIVVVAGVLAFLIPKISREKSGSSDYCVPGSVKAHDFQLEKFLVSEPISLPFHCFDFVVGSLQRAC